MFSVTLVHVCPRSSETCTSPSLDPVQITPSCRAIPDCKENGGVCGPPVVQREPLRALLFGFVVRVRSGLNTAQLWPPFVVTWHVLATHVDALVIVWRNVDREGPLGSGIGAHPRPIPRRWPATRSPCGLAPTGDRNVRGPRRNTRPTRCWAPPGSGTENPVSQPPTDCHSPMEIRPFVSELLGPISVPPSWRFPYTEYGIRVSVFTWYICAMGSRGRHQLTPRSVETLTPPSWPTIIRPAEADRSTCRDCRHRGFRTRNLRRRLENGCSASRESGPLRGRPEP